MRPRSAAVVPLVLAIGFVSGPGLARAAGSPPAKQSGSQGSQPQKKGPAKPKSTEEAAKEAFDSAVKAAALLKRATELFREGRYAEAEKELKAADRLQPDYAPALEQLSLVQAKLGKDDDALATIERAIRRGTGFDDKAYLIAARTFTRKKMFAEGEKQLVAWAGKRPRTANFHAALGILRMGKFDFGPADEVLRAALEMDPANEPALSTLALLYTRASQVALLQPFLDKAVATKPDSITILMLSANNLLVQTQYGPAKSLFEKILERDPKNTDAQVNLASALHGLGDVEGAIRGFRKAIAMDPKNPQAPVNLAFALGREKRPQEARDVLLEARKHGVETIDLLNSLTLAYRLNGETDAAIATAQESLARNQRQPDVRKMLGELEIEKRHGPPSLPSSPPAGSDPPPPKAGAPAPPGEAPGPGA